MTVEETKKPEPDKYPVVVDVKIAGVDPVPGWIEKKIEEFMKSIWAIPGTVQGSYSHRVMIQHPKNIRSIILKFFIRQEFNESPIIQPNKNFIGKILGR